MDIVKQVLLTQMASVLTANRKLQTDLICTRYRMEEQAQEIDHVRREARTDTLTSVGNRKAFDEKLDMCLANWERRRESFVLILMDLDHFKRINDSHGHQAGDQSWRRLVAGSRRGSARGTLLDAMGDEFAILLPHTDLPVGLQRAEMIRNQIAEEASG